MPKPPEHPTCGLNASELRCILFVVLDKRPTLDADQAHRLMQALGYKSPTVARTVFNRAMVRLRANASALTTPLAKKDDHPKDDQPAGSQGGDVKEGDSDEDAEDDESDESESYYGNDNDDAM